MIFKVSIVYGRQLNVVSNGEFVERKFNHFFMRTELSGKFKRVGDFRKRQVMLPGCTFMVHEDKGKKTIYLNGDVD